MTYYIWSILSEMANYYCKHSKKKDTIWAYTHHMAQRIGIHLQPHQFCCCCCHCPK